MVNQACCSWNERMSVRAMLLPAGSFPPSSQQGRSPAMATAVVVSLQARNHPHLLV